MSDRKKVAALFGELSRVYAELCREMGGTPEAARTERPVSDADLDGPHGRPKIRMDPRDWRGESCKGRLPDACPPEFLDLYAETLDYFAGKNADAGDAKKAGYDRKDAARIRGWAARIRNGWKAAEPSNGAMPGGPMPGDPMGDEDFT